MTARKQDGRTNSAVMGSVEELRNLCHDYLLLNLGDSENASAFKAFVDLILTGIVRKLFFHNKKCEKPLSTYVTVADKAFGLLILENNFQKWEKYIEIKVGMEGENGARLAAKKCKTRYAVGGKSSAWANDQKAIGRYNAFIIMVKEKRELQPQQERETEIMNEYANGNTRKNTRGLKRKFYDEEDNTEDLLEDPMLPLLKPVDLFQL